MKWKKEDDLYAPKRKVDNKGSRKRPHIIGSFFSNKNGIVVEYHSLNECIFFYLLEVDRTVLRYYPQPVEVPLVALNKKGQIHKWVHVPDVLVFRDNRKPYLFQVKESPENLSKIAIFNNIKANNYARKRGWEYKMIFPKQMPKVVIKNLKFLVHYLRERDYFSFLGPNIIRTLKRRKSLTIRELSNYAPKTYHSSYVYPYIYYLMAMGYLLYDLEKPITLETELKSNSQFTEGFLDKYIMLDGEKNAI